MSYKSYNDAMSLFYSDNPSERDDASLVHPEYTGQSNGMSHILQISAVRASKREVSALLFDHIMRGEEEELTVEESTCCTCLGKCYQYLTVEGTYG